MTDTLLLNISVMYYMCNVKVENKKINYKKNIFKEVIVRFVDIGRIGGHHFLCMYFLFIK